ncbi:MAG: hypothetical protein ACLTXT_03840 [Ruminococcus callidus]
MIRKRTTLTTTERKQRLFCLLFGSVLLGAALGMSCCGGSMTACLRAGQAFWECFFRPSLLFRHSDGERRDILLFLLAFFLLGFSAVGQPFAWLLLLTYGVRMGGTLQTQCNAGGALCAVRRCCAICADVGAAGAGGEESPRFSGYFTAYGFRNEPEEQMYHQLRMLRQFVVLAVFLLLFGFAYGTAFYAAVK